MKAFLNGEWFEPDQSGTPTLRHCLSLTGRGLFEVLRVREGRIEFIGAHLDRLFESASTLGIPIQYGRERLADELKRCVECNGGGELALRLSVSFGGEDDESLDNRTDETATLITAARYIPPLPERLVGGFNLATAPFPRNEHSPLALHKTLSDVEATLAERGARRLGADEALFLNGTGRVACAARANLFMVVEGRLLTPPIEEGAFPGIVRGVVIRSARELGYRVEERAIEPEQLLAIPEVFLTSSLLGLAPVARIDGRRLPDPTARPMIPHLRIRFRQHAGAGAEEEP